MWDDGFGLIQHWSELNRVQIVSFKGKLLICEATAGHHDKPSCSFDLVDIWGITFNVWIIIVKGSDLSVDSRFCLIIIQRVWRSSIYWCVRVGGECEGWICVQKIQLSDFVYSLEKSIALLHPLADSEFVTSRAQPVIKHSPTFPHGSPACFQGHCTNFHLRVCVCVRAGEGGICLQTHLLLCMCVKYGGNSGT